MAERGDRQHLLDEDDGLTDWLRSQTSLLWEDIQAWTLFIGRWLLNHFPLGQIIVYPPTESANFAVVNNEKTRLRAIARKKKEGAWRVGLRWICLLTLGIFVACLYQIIHTSIDYVDEVGI